MNKKRIEIVLKNIERLKTELELLYEEQGLNEEVVKKSEELDEYIVEYYRLLKKSVK